MAMTSSVGVMLGVTFLAYQLGASGSGSSSGLGSTRWTVRHNSYCKVHHRFSISHFPDYNMSMSDCQRKCEDNPHCVGFAMQCAHQCILIPHCQETVSSRCGSYVVIKPNLQRKQKASGAAMMVHPQANYLTADVGGCFLACMAAGCFSLVLSCCQNADKQTEDPASSWRCDAISCDAIMPRADSRPEDPEKSGYTPPGLPDAENSQNAVAEADDEEDHSQNSPEVMKACSRHSFRQKMWKRRRIGWAVLVILCLIPVSYAIIAAFHLSKDPKTNGHGFCGLIHGDENASPFTFIDYLAWRMSSGARGPKIPIHGRRYSPPATEVLPMECMRVYASDLVSKESAKGCLPWCEAVMGQHPQWLCSLLVPELKAVYQVCSKVIVTVWLFFWMNSDLIWCLKTLVPLSYCCLGVALGYRKYLRFKDEDAFSEDLISKPTDEVVHCPKRFNFPWCLVGSRSDKLYCKVELGHCLFAFVMDAWGDVNAAMSLLMRGQIYYAALIASFIMIPHLGDPFQSVNFAAVMLSLTERRGFATYALLLAERREGAIEGAYSVVFAIYALMRGVFYGSFEIEHWIYVSLLFMVFSSLGLVMPKASVASLLIADKTLGDHDHFNREEETKKKMNPLVLKLPQFDTLALAVAVGRCFTGLNLLVWLWFFGFIIGVLGWLFWVLFRLKDGAPETKSAVAFICAFLFWPLSVTRLLGACRVWDGMRTGEWSDDEMTFTTLTEICYKGCASLRPSFFYGHRVLTLTVFWAFTFIRSDGELFIWGGYVDHLLGASRALLKGDFTIWLDLTTGGDLCMPLLFVVGWFSIVYEAIVAFMYGAQFDYNYRRLSVHTGPMKAWSRWSVVTLDEGDLRAASEQRRARSGKAEANAAETPRRASIADEASSNDKPKIQKAQTNGTLSLPLGGFT